MIMSDVRFANLFLLMASVALEAQTTTVKELKFRFDGEARVRPGETVAVQIQVWGEVTAADGSKTTGRLRDTATAKVAEGQGWISKPFRFQGTDDGGFINNASGFAAVLQTVSGQFLQKDAVLYMAPLQAGTYTLEAEAKGVNGTATITVAADAPARKTAEKHNFPAGADNNRHRKLAEYWAPFIAQESWWQPKADVPTRFDYDGDWNGDNNWDNLDAGTSQAYVYYAAVETGTHWFLHYNFFHPRDYSDNCIAGTCHENDNEGVILAVRKGEGEFGTLEVMETLAHNNVYSYTNETRLRKGAHDIDGKIDFHDGHHPIVFLEAGGHGALGAASSNSTYSPSRGDFRTGSGMTFVYKGAAERPAHGNDRNVGYDLLPIEETWWARTQQQGAKTFDSPYVYEPFGNRPGGGRRYMGAFLGRKHGANKAKPFWGWHDERTRRGKVLNTGQWALDPAYAVTKNLIFPAALPVDLNYVYNPFLGVGEVVAAAPQAPAAPAEGTCQLEAVIDGSAVISFNGATASYQILSGQPEKEASIGCNGAIPASPLREFEVRKNKGRGSIKTLAAPEASNGFTARVQVDDTGRGADRYVLVLRWKL